MPLVSVILPVFNHAQYVGETIASVLAQTHRDLEIVACDNASTDGTVDVIRACSDPRVRLAVNERNVGGAANMNRCVGMARGELIAIISSDDLWSPDKLERQLAVLAREPAVAAVFSDVHIIDERGQELLGEAAGPLGQVFRQQDRGRHQWLHDLFWRHNALCHPSALVRAACVRAVGGWNESLAQLLDFDLWVRVCMRYDIRVLPERLVRFRVFADESNASGRSPVKVMRSDSELLQVLRRYAALEFGEFLQVFPAFPHRTAADASLPTAFHLACLCLAEPEPPRVPHIYRQLGWLLLHQVVERGLVPLPLVRARVPLFDGFCGQGAVDQRFVLARLAIACGGFAAPWGLAQLLDLMSDPSTAERLARDHGFLPTELIELSGAVPLFASPSILQHQQTHDELVRTRREIDALLAARPGEAVMRTQAHRLERELMAAQEALRATEHGASFRLGRALTWPLRGLRSVLKKG